MPVSQELCGLGPLGNASSVSVTEQNHRAPLRMVVEPTMQLDAIVCREPCVDGIVVVSLSRCWSPSPRVD